MNIRLRLSAKPTVGIVALFTVCITVAMMLFLGFHRAGAQGDGSSLKKSVYVEAVEILKNFVRGGDHQLGFADTTEFSGAYLDTAQSIPVYQFLIDSLNVYHMDTSVVFTEHRTLFPVLVDSVIHSYVLFDSVFDSGIRLNHWAPVQFSASRRFEH